MNEETMKVRLTSQAANENVDLNEREPKTSYACLQMYANDEKCIGAARNDEGC